MIMNNNEFENEATNQEAPPEPIIPSVMQDEKSPIGAPRKDADHKIFDQLHFSKYEVKNEQTPIPESKYFKYIVWTIIIVYLTVTTIIAFQGEKGMLISSIALFFGLFIFIYLSIFMFFRHRKKK